MPANILGENRRTMLQVAVDAASETTQTHITNKASDEMKMSTPLRVPRGMFH